MQRALARVLLLLAVPLCAVGPALTGERVFAPLLPAVNELLDVSGALVSQHPNVDLSLGALTYVAGLPADVPLFAIARLAGWTAHYLEELEERPLRFRGLAR